jgi:succinoglycan biosynthesis protein ExoA
LKPSVSVLIPTFNEEADIEECLDAVAAQDVGAGLLEVVMVDGGSTDRTVARATGHAQAAGFGSFVVIENPARRTAAGLALGLQHVTAPYVVRVDARSRIPHDYVRMVTGVLEQRPDVGVVGGAQVPLDRAGGAVGSGIARALSNRYTTGLGRYRRSATSGPADTVWMGAFRTADLRAVGGWDPEHGINEDYELNARFIAAGYTVWFEGSVRSGYVPRRDLPALARQYYSYGRAKGSAWRDGQRPAPRQLALLGAPAAAAAIGVLSSRRIGLARTALIGAMTLLAIDEIGGPKSRASLRVRFAAVTATLTFSAAWLSGVVTGWRKVAR